MKTININDSISALLTKYNAFYAFNTEQFSTQVDAKIKYKDLGAGLYCPVTNVNLLVTDMNALMESKVKFELENNTPEQIMTSLFDNHECYYTGDYSDVYEELKDYGFSDELIEETWESYCIYNGNGSLIW